ncbi:MAG: FecR domain-containing protein [Saprospiraceae bacterium]|nr:FecR domain-containing protein [Saprospiraceae bacterium]
MKSTKQFFTLLFVAFLLILSSSKSYGQETYSSILNDIDRREGVEIGQLEWQLKDPGWWQYSPSCDASKWISVGDNYERRDDYRARCDLQVHDYETEVVPTLTEAVEINVPEDGRILIYYELKEEEGYELEPNLSAHLHSDRGPVQSIHGWLGGKNKFLPSPAHDNDFFSAVYKGDKIVVKSEARLRSGPGERAFFPCDLKVKAFLLPSGGPKIKIPDGGTDNNKEGKVLSINGPTFEGCYTSESGNGPWKEVKVGDPVYIDRFYKTDKNTGAELRLPSPHSDTRIKLRRNTKIRIVKRIHKTKRSGVFLVVGRLMSLFGGDKSKGYAVETYNCIAAVEGTEFEVAYDSLLKQSTVSVSEGEVNVSCKNDPLKSHNLIAGEKATVNDDCLLQKSNGVHDPRVQNPEPTTVATMNLDKTSFEPGEMINVHFKAPGTFPNNAWIGIIPSSIPHGSEEENEKHDVAYQYLDKRTSGTFSFRAPAIEGNYDFRMHNTSSNGKEVTHVSFTVRKSIDLNSVPTIRLDKTSFQPGEMINVHFTAPGSFPNNAWIGIIPSSIPHGSEEENEKHDVAYQYLNKRTSGTFSFRAPAIEGRYDFRMHNTSSNGKEVTHVSFRVISF